MKITSATILIACVSLIAIIYIVRRLKRDTIGFRSAVTWLALWLCIGFFGLFPGLLNSAMRLAQMQNRMFFILVTAVFILFALVFNLSSRIEYLHRNIARLVQELAILNADLDEIKNRRKDKDDAER